MQISYSYIYIYIILLLLAPPSSLPSQLSGLSQSTRLGSL